MPVAEVDRKRLKEVMAKQLLHGSHSPDGKMCVMEAVAYVAGEKRSRRPTPNGSANS